MYGELYLDRYIHSTLITNIPCGHACIHLWDSWGKKVGDYATPWMVSVFTELFYGRDKFTGEPYDTNLVYGRKRGFW